MTSYILTVLFFGVLSICPTLLLAKSMYITDRIEAGLRSGIGIEQRIVAMVKTGDPVELLEGDKTWSKVRLNDGTVGWIATRFLVDQVKPVNLTDPTLQGELKGLREKNQGLSREKELLNQEKKNLLEEVKKLTQSLQHEKAQGISPELAALKTKNEKLDKEIALYKKQLDDLMQKGKDRPSDEKVKWFFAGSAVLGFGLALGWLFSKGR
ncbi:MAG: TIGR04211 family SH3 domain-containing protein, partial [Desulfobacca sp.]|nr:TIGR04211 family SH3 domain-containing protein [Desulfobacca sp.]